MRWKSTGKPMLLVMLLPVSLLLTGCQTMGSGETDKAYCRAFKPVAWSVRDTPETIDQTKANNAVGVALCGWKGR